MGLDSGTVEVKTIELQDIVIVQTDTCMKKLIQPINLGHATVYDFNHIYV